MLLSFFSPNSCGQVQAADIGIMGAPAKKEIDGKKVAVPGCNIFVGGRIGEDAHLSLVPEHKNIPLEDADLLPILVEILKRDFGATDRKVQSSRFPPIRRLIDKVKSKLE
jgi:ferredoxin-nitrite reductase